jgi:hypothetical protein
MAKTYGNTSASKAEENVRDIKFWGNGDTWKLISKAWSEEEEWLKSTKALEIKSIGCLLQVSTQNEDLIAEAVTFVPNVRIKEIEEGGKVVSREVISF